MAIDPDKWLKENAQYVDSKPAAVAKEAPPEELSDEDVNAWLEKNAATPEEDGIGTKILKGVGAAAELYDSYTGAPLRAGVGALLDDDEDSGFFTSAYRQFGAPTDNAPTGEELVKKLGVEEKPLIEEDGFISEIGKKLREGSTGRLNILGKAIGAAQDNISNTDVAGLGAEMALDPLALLSGGMKATAKVANAIPMSRNMIKTAASRRAIKALSNIPSNSEMRNLVKRRMPEIVGQVLVEEDLAGSIGNPKKLYEKIAGKKSVEYSRKKIGSKDYDFAAPQKQGGLISDISKETDDIISQVSKNVSAIDVDDLRVDILSQDVFRRFDPQMASKLSAKDIQKHSDIVNEYLKPASGRKRTLKQLQELKRSIGEKLSSKDFFNPQDKSIAFEKAVLKDIYHNLKRKIEDAADGVNLVVDGKNVNAGDILKMNNDRVTHLMDVKSLLENVDADSLRDPSLIQMAIDGLASGAIGLGTYSISGSSVAGGTAAAAYGATKLGQAFSKKFPGIEANILNKILQGNLIPKTPVRMSVGSKLFTSDMMDDQDSVNPGREPKSLPEALITTQIPRDTEEILQKKEFILAKAAQQAPELYDSVKEVLEGHPEKLPELLPPLIGMAPHLFQYDKYNRVDSVIIDPQMKDRARKDTMLRDDLSKIQKAQIINELNKTGKFYDN